MPPKPDIHAGLSLYATDLVILKGLALRLSTVDRRLKYRRVVRFLAHATSATRLLRSARKFSQKQPAHAAGPVSEHADVVLLAADLAKILAVERALLICDIESNTTEILRATWHDLPPLRVLAKAFAKFDVRHPDRRSKAGRGRARP
jgi:hypothetical protein